MKMNWHLTEAEFDAMTDEQAEQYCACLERRMERCRRAQAACAARIKALEEFRKVLEPEYLGYTGHSLDVRSQILKQILKERRP